MKNILLIILSFIIAVCVCHFLNLEGVIRAVIFIVAGLNCYRLIKKGK